MADWYVGLMSGTSMDAIDAVVVDMAPAYPRLLAHHCHPLPASVKAELLALCTPGDNEIDRMGYWDNHLGELFAEVSLTLLRQADIAPAKIKAIGSHGQTIRHRPDAAAPFTLQLGNPNVIAERTGVTTVADFRRRDMAAGGQGAPLVPAFHQRVFQSSGHARVVVNIGGIANITVLPAQTHLPVLGFDTGPGNCLMDEWILEHRALPLDRNGSWAASGQVDTALLEDMLADEYFALPPPKSTGREYFNRTWIQRCLIDSAAETATPQDVQATLCALTAHSIGAAISGLPMSVDEVLVCGGGAHNSFLMEQLGAQLPACRVAGTDALGIDPDWVEAMAFAWLARQTLLGLAGNLPSVTGASHPVVLGGIYPAPR